MSQKEYYGLGSIIHIEDILKIEKPQKIFLVSGKSSYRASGAKKALEDLSQNKEVTVFTDFSPNPKLKDVIKGLKLFGEEQDIVIAVGGGSVIDMAKLINIFAAQKHKPITYIRKEGKLENKGKPLVAIPTTAGSGTEATHFAVVYANRVKHSIAHDSILPAYVILDSTLTLSMPASITASTGIDALSQAIEAYWSVNSIDESRALSEKAIKLILENLKSSVYNPTLESRKAMTEAANFAGKAINIAKTTAAHALSYIFTSKFGIPHGHAVGLTLGLVLEYNAGITDKDCNDKRGMAHVNKVLDQLCLLLNCTGYIEAKNQLNKLMSDIGLEMDVKQLGVKKRDIEEIINNVNCERLSNNPRVITKKGLSYLLNGLIK